LAPIFYEMVSFGQPVVPAFAFVYVLAYLLPQEIPLATHFS
jgi:hypothetical protein